MAHWQVAYGWTDNNGHAAQCKVWYSQALGFSQVESRALALAAVLQAVSSARLDTIGIKQTTQTPGTPDAAPGSDVLAYLVLFYGNDTGAATFLVPSPGPLPLDVDGPYRNVRLDLATLPVPGVLSDLGVALAGTNTPTGQAWYPGLLAGGFTRYGGE